MPLPGSCDLRTSVVREFARERPKRLVQLLPLGQARDRPCPIPTEPGPFGTGEVAITTARQMFLNLCVEGTYVEQLGCPAGNVTIVSLH